MATLGDAGIYQMVVNAAEVLFRGERLDEAARMASVSQVLAGTRRVKGFVFYPTEAEWQAGIRLITGEKPRTRLLAANAVELEILRLLALLAPGMPAVQALFREADRRLEQQCFASVCLVGECAGASIAYLRYLTARGVEAYRAKIEHGLAAVKQDRKGNGRWQHFPYRFTCRWLAELPAGFAEQVLVGDLNF
jgi:hypothetical protein